MPDWQIVERQLQQGVAFVREHGQALRGVEAAVATGVVEQLWDQGHDDPIALHLACPEKVLPQDLVLDASDNDLPVPPKLPPPHFVHLDAFFCGAMRGYCHERARPAFQRARIDPRCPHRPCARYTMLSRRFNKVLTVFAVLCDEIHELRLAAENEFYPALAVFGMPPHESDGGLNAALDKEPPVPTMSHIAKALFSDRARCVGTAMHSHGPGPGPHSCAVLCGSL